jgi:hypothetical protein
MNENPLVVMNYLASENTDLKYNLACKDRLIHDMQCKINSLMRMDILRMEDLTITERGIEYCVIKNDGTPGSFILYANWQLAGVKVAEFDIRYKKENGVILIINSNRGNKNILVEYEDFEPKRLIKILELNGFAVLLRDTKEKLGALMMKLISKFMDGAEVEFIPYSTGWCKDIHGKMEYIYSYGKPYELNAPVNNNILPITHTNERIKSCELAMGALRVFREPMQRVILTAMLINSLIFSLLKEKKLEVKQLAVISGDTDAVNRIVDFFFNIFQHTGYTALSQKCAEVRKAIIETKDAPLIIESRDCSFRDRKENENWTLIRNMVCYDGSIDIGSTAVNLQAPIILLNNELGYVLEPEYFFELELNKDALNLKALRSIPDCKERLGDMISGFFQYVATINFNAEIRRTELKPVNDIYEDTYKALCVAMNIFTDYLEVKYAFQIDKMLELKHPWNSYLSAYFNRDVEDSKSVISEFMKSLYECVDDGELEERDFYGLSENDNLEDFVFVLDDEVMIKHDTIMNQVIPKMQINITARKLFGYLKRENMIVHTRGSNESKRTIKFADGVSRRESFVVLKGKYYKSRTKINKEVSVNEATGYWDF